MSARLLRYGAIKKTNLNRHGAGPSSDLLAPGRLIGIPPPPATGLQCLAVRYGPARCASTAASAASSPSPGGSGAPHPPRTHMDAAQQAQAARFKAWVIEHAGTQQLPTDADAVLMHGE